MTLHQLQSKRAAAVASASRTLQIQQVLVGEGSHPDKVKVYGPGVEKTGLKANEPTYFTVDCSEAGQGEAAWIDNVSGYKNTPEFRWTNNALHLENVKNGKPRKKRTSQTEAEQQCYLKCMVVLKIELQVMKL